MMKHLKKKKFMKLELRIELNMKWYAWDKKFLLTLGDFDRVEFYATDTDPWLNQFSQFWAERKSPFSLWAVGGALFFVLR